MHMCEMLPTWFFLNLKLVVWRKKGGGKKQKNKLPNDDAPSHMQYNLEIAAAATIH